jgi:superfamily II DNA or RNA helicase
VLFRSWPEVYRYGIIENEARNKRIVGIAHTIARDNGIPTIVLVQRREHADMLGERIENSIVVKGGENALTSAGVDAFTAGRYDVLIGTSVIGEGVDRPRAAALIYAGGGEATVQMMQSYYRPLTAAKGKTVGLIYDFEDTQHRILQRHSASRLLFAKKHLGDCVKSL